jgi:uncharacterized protein (DUF362 family)/Pyruvate/2-oxoacid:ferredoxin oxidoreductase delta subunit
MKRSQVSISECKSYDQPVIAAALEKALDLIGGLGSIVKPGQTVLLKVNALSNTPPDKAATTHPAIVSALVKMVLKLGATPVVGDSPGDASANIDKTMRENGIKPAAEEAGGKMVNFHRCGVREIKSPSNNKNVGTIKLANAVLDADVVINLPKLKTHGLTVFTGAIKNLFGCVTGFSKAKFHAAAPDAAELSKSFVDILEITKPALNIMDAVWGMEGSGPQVGDPRFMGAIMASRDATALDAVAASAIGCDPLSIATTRIAGERGLGKSRLEEIEVLGWELKKITHKDWRKPPGVHRLLRYIPKFAYRLLRPILDQLGIDPVIIQEKCTRCRICLNNCPTHTIHEKNGKIYVDHRDCIMCYCCHELCPHRAIRLKRRLLTRLIWKGPDD